jgi:hypothetical protein
MNKQKEITDKMKHIGGYKVLCSKLNELQKWDNKYQLYSSEKFQNIWLILSFKDIPQAVI